MTADTVRLWCPAKPHITKNTAKIRSNTMGFYALNGGSVVDFPENSKKEDYAAFPDGAGDANRTGASS